MADAPSWNADVSVIPLQRGLVSAARSRLLILFGAVAVILLISCADVANLTLARAATRDREIATRAALGAGRDALPGSSSRRAHSWHARGLLGLAFAVQGTEWLKLIVPPDMPRLADVQMNWRSSRSVAPWDFHRLSFWLGPGHSPRRTSLAGPRLRRTRRC